MTAAAARAARVRPARPDLPCPVTDYWAAAVAVLRAAAYPGLPVPPWPDLSDATPERAIAWADWLRQVQDIAEVAGAVELASPGFADTVRRLGAASTPGVRETRRAVLTMIRYLLRMTGRCTPAGLMAGVAPVRFGPVTSVRWGEDHRAVLRAGAQWLAEVISQLEGAPDVLARLPVMTNTTLFARGNRLIVPYRAADAGAADVSIRGSGPVRMALEAASAPVVLGDLAAKVLAEFPDAGRGAVSAMLTGLVRCGALITSLPAPGTEPDALGHLVSELETTGAGEFARTLRKIHDLLQRQHRAPACDTGSGCREVVALMRSVARTGQHPLAADLRLDADLTVPEVVAREAERAAVVLARLAVHPAGTPAWRAYHQRFYERYGLGSLVPLLDMVSDSGIGWPDGYPGTPEPEHDRLSQIGRAHV